MSNRSNHAAEFICASLNRLPIEVVYSVQHECEFLLGNPAHDPPPSDETPSRTIARENWQAHTQVLGMCDRLHRDGLKKVLRCCKACIKAEGPFPLGVGARVLATYCGRKDVACEVTVVGTKYYHLVPLVVLAYNEGYRRYFAVPKDAKMVRLDMEESWEEAFSPDKLPFLYLDEIVLCKGWSDGTYRAANVQMLCDAREEVRLYDMHPSSSHWIKFCGREYVRDKFARMDASALKEWAKFEPLRDGSFVRFDEKVYVVAGIDLAQRQVRCTCGAVFSVDAVRPAAQAELAKAYEEQQWDLPLSSLKKRRTGD